MSCHCKGKCCGAKIAWILVLVGALNWGLVGLGHFVGSDLNLVKLALGSWPAVEAVVYILVGLAAIMVIVGCPCKKCKDSNANCAACKVEEKKA